MTLERRTRHIHLGAICALERKYREEIRYSIQSSGTSAYESSRGIGKGE
jgi:hypothetical protein